MNESRTTRLGMAYHRQGDRPFGIHLRDRLLHLYLIGQTGTGKSTLLRNMAVQDASQGIGLCLVDPHGDLAEDLSSRLAVPHIHWRLADPACPFGYNPLAHVRQDFRPLICSGLIEAFQKQWQDAWGPRMEHLLRHAILALLDRPHSDLRDIMRLYLEKGFREEVLSYVTDQQIRQFWLLEYPGMNYKNAADGVAPIANKLGAFLAHPVVRTALCEPRSPLRFRSIMDEGGVLIVNLAKGRLGADNANVLGGLITASVMNAAFSRHTLPPEGRRPFMLYVDEFHAFTTGAFATMLSEVRKYGLGVTMAHQHIVQAEADVFESIMGNAGSRICFRIGALDAPTMVRQFADMREVDLLNLPNFHAVGRIMVKGSLSRPFSFKTEAEGA